MCSSVLCSIFFTETLLLACVICSWYDYSNALGCYLPSLTCKCMKFSNLVPILENNLCSFCVYVAYARCIIKVRSIGLFCYYRGVALRSFQETSLWSMTALCVIFLSLKLGT